VCARFSLTVQELVSPRRSQAVAYPRQVAMYLSRKLTDSSLPKIGKEFGGRDQEVNSPRHPVRGWREHTEAHARQMAPGLGEDERLRRGELSMIGKPPRRGARRRASPRIRS